MAGEKYDQLLQIYGQKSEGNTLHFGGKPVNDQLFAGLSMVLAHSDSLREELELEEARPVNGTEPLRGDVWVPKGDIQKIQAYMTAALESNETDGLLSMLAEGLNRLGAQIRGYDWKEPSCCAVASLLAETMAALEKMPKPLTKLKESGLSNETRSNITVGKLMSETMEKRALAEQALLSDGQLTNEKQSEYARDFVKAELLLEMRGPSMQVNNGESTAFPSMLRDLAGGSQKMSQAVDFVTEHGLGGDYQNLYSANLRERQTVIEHPAPMEKAVEQVGRKWFETYSNTTQKPWAEIFKRRTLARRRIRKSIEEQKQQGKTSFQADPSDVAWLITEKVVTGELEKAAQDGPANYEFLHLFADYQNLGEQYLTLFGEAMKNYCVEQGVGRKDTYTESELLGDDIGQLYQENLISEYVKANDQYRLAFFEKKEREYREAREFENQEERPSPAAQRIEEIDRRQQKIHDALLRYQNVYGPTIDREQDSTAIILLQRNNIAKDSEFICRGYEPMDVAAFGLLTAMSIKENVDYIRYNDAFQFRAIRELDVADGVDWDAIGKAHIFVHMAEDVFANRPNISEKVGTLLARTRLKLKDSFQALEQGNVEPLGRIIGENIDILTSAAFPQQGGREISAVSLSYGAMLSQILKVLDGNPALKESAMRHGMEEKHLKALHAAKKIGEISQNGMEAERVLLDENKRPKNRKELRDKLVDYLTERTLQRVLEKRYQDFDAKIMEEVEKEGIRDAFNNPNYAGTIQSAAWSVATVKLAPSEELLKLGDPEELNKLRDQIANSELVQEMIARPKLLDAFQKNVMLSSTEKAERKMKEQTDPFYHGLLYGQEAVKLADRNKVDLNNVEQLAKGQSVQEYLKKVEAERRYNEIEAKRRARVRTLEEEPKIIADFNQDVVDVYGSRVRHIEGKGKDNKEKTQNLIQDRTMYDLPDGFTQKQIAALNVLTGLSMENMEDLNPKGTNYLQKQAEVTEYLQKNGVDTRVMDGLVWTNSDQIQDLVKRRPNSLDRSCGPKILNPARAKMKKALDAYIDRQDPEPLGQILGKTLDIYVGLNKTGQADAGLIQYSDLAETVYQLLKSDPKLEESARRHGLTDPTMQTLAAEGALEQHFLDSVEAEKQILSKEKLEPEEFYDCMSGLVLDVLVRSCIRENREAEDRNMLQISEQMKQKLPKPDEENDRIFETTKEQLIGSEAINLANVKTPGTENFRKLSDPNLKKNIREAVEKNKELSALLEDPEKLKEFRLELANRAHSITADYSKEYVKNWLPVMMDLARSALDSCKIPEERPLKDKCEEAEKLLGVTREELEKQAGEKNIPLSEYIDQAETEKLWKDRASDRTWLRQVSGLLGMSKEQLTAQARTDNMTVAEKVEQYKNVIRGTAQRYGMSEEQFYRAAEEKHTDILTLSNQINETAEKLHFSPEQLQEMAANASAASGVPKNVSDVVDAFLTAERLNLSLEQLQQMAENASAVSGTHKSIIDVAEALSAEEDRAERAYEQQTVQKAFDEKTRKLEESANVGENVKQLIQLAKVAHSDVMEALKEGREDGPAIGQMKIPQNVSLDVLALCEQVLADREKNGNRPGKLERQIEKAGFSDVIMKIHHHKPEAQAEARRSITVEKLKNAVKGGGFGALLGVGKGAAALEKAAGVPQKPQNKVRNVPQHI